MPDGLLIQIGADVSQGVAGLRQLKDELNNLQRQGKLSLGGVQTSMKDFQTALKTATNPVQIQGFNLAIKALGDKAKDLKTAGLEKTIGGIGGAANKAFASLRQLANIIPGIGIAGLIGFAIDPLIEGFKKLTSQAGKAVDAQKNFATALAGSGKTYQEAASNVNELRTNIELAKDGFLNKDKVVKQFNETLGKTVGQVSNLNEAEASLLKNGEAYIKMTLFKAAANVALAEASKKAFEIALKLNAPPTRADLIAGGDTEQRTAQRLAEQNEEVLALTKEANEAFFAGNKKLADELFKKRNELQTSLAEGGRFKGLRAEQQSFLDIFKKLQSDAAAIAKEFKFDLFGGEFDPKKIKPEKWIDPFKIANTWAKLISGAFNSVTILPEGGQLFDKFPIATALEDAINKGITNVKDIKSNILANTIATDLNLNLVDKFGPLFAKLKANLPAIDFNLAPSTNEAGLTKELKALQLIKDQTQLAAQAITDVLAPAFQNLFSSILAGEDPIKAFFNSVIQSIQQVISKLIAAAIQAAIFSLILPGGGGGFSKLFQKALGFSQSAAPGRGYGGGSQAVHHTGRFEIEGTKMLLVLNRTIASQGRTG